jgi:hypothetical protein
MNELIVALANHYGRSPTPTEVSQAQKLIDYRITCDAGGYPLCESRYVDVADYENQTGDKFEELP